jgi:hypothetical protein
MATPDFGSTAWNQVNKAVTSGTKKLVNTGRKVAEIAAFAAPEVKVGKVVGEVAGRAAARAIATDSRGAMLKAADKARGAGKMVTSKPETGNKVSTAARRDVVVKTEDKTLATNGFINKNGEKSVKVNTDKPTVRTVEKAVSNETAAQRTAASNRLRYGGAKAETNRMQDAVSNSNLAAKTGANTGRALGAAPAIVKGTQDNHAVTSVDRKTGKAK